MRTHTLAVYGTLRKGHGNHRCIEGAEFLGKFIVKHHMMWSNGAFPYICYAPCKHVVVEVFEVNDAQFKRCDGLEGYPTHYQRKLIPFFLDVKDPDPIGLAWIYYVTEEPDRNADIIPSGDWEVHVIEERKKEKERQAKAQIAKSTTGRSFIGSTKKEITFENEYGYYEYDPVVGRSYWVARSKSSGLYTRRPVPTNAR